MNVITNVGSGAVIYPTIIEDYRYRISHRQTFHDIINRVEPVVTLGPRGLRSGTLRILCETYAGMVEARDLHSDRGVVQWQSYDITEGADPDILMAYIPTNVEVVIRENQTSWNVDVDYQEVTRGY